MVGGREACARLDHPRFAHKVLSALWSTQLPWGIEVTQIDLQTFVSISVKVDLEDNKELVRHVTWVMLGKYHTQIQGFPVEWVL
jgi:hypothetical protein